MNDSASSVEDLIRNIGEETALWSPAFGGCAAAKEVLANKVVLLYFSAHWCGPCKKFTPLLRDLYLNLKAKRKCPQYGHTVEDFEIVFCSMDAFECEYNHYIKDMPWWCLPFQSPITTKLANFYKAQGIPSLVVIDKCGQTVISPCAVEQLTRDPQGHNFPWRPKTFVELLPEHYLQHQCDSFGRRTIVHRPTKELDDKYLLVYAAGLWCKPCIWFTHKLGRAYENLKRYRQDFEMLYLSSDQDEHSFSTFFDQMPFSAIPYEERAAKAAIANKFSIRRVPAVLVFGPRPATGCDRPLINADVRSIFEGEDYIADFPYKPKKYGDLNRTTHNINSSRCVVVFGEHCDDSEQEDVEEALKCAADSYMGADDVKFFWVFEPTQFTQTLRSALKLPAMEEKVHMVFLDIPDKGAFYVSDQDDVTTPSILSFLDRPGERRQI